MNCRPRPGWPVSKSQRLRLSDVRAVFRVLDEARELGADPAGWRAHVLDRLADLIGGVVCVGAETENRPDGSQLTPGPVHVDFRWPGPAEDRLFRRYLALELPLDPGVTRMVVREVAGRAGRVTRGAPALTRTRRQLVADGPWYRSAHFNEVRRPLRIDDALHSHCPLPRTAAVSLLSFIGYQDRAAFSDRERRLLDLLHAELARLWWAAAESPAARLPPRPAQVLGLLLDGRSEKEAAARLGLSPHTVHQYVKLLYRHFRVTTRAELLAGARCRLPVPRLASCPHLR